MAAGQRVSLALLAIFFAFTVVACSSDPVLERKDPVDKRYGAQQESSSRGHKDLDKE